MLTMHAASTNAQCPAGRYNSEMFPAVTKTTVTYSTPYNLLMDVYEPTGDALAARPVIILAHGGSFYAGTRTDDVTVDSLCVRFARRGYVTASIDYRLAASFADMVNPDSTLAINEVARAISDGKAAVRYFRQDAATTNTYRIDTNNIFSGGNSAGAVLYMHVGYLSSIAECPSYIATAMAANGGFDGNSGNAGYSSKIKAVVDLAGALNQTSFINAGDVPSVNAQGDGDNVVNYTCGYPLSGFCRVQLCGMGSLESQMTANGIYHMTHIFPGDGHVPWSSDAAKFKTVDSMVTVFLYNMVCSNVASVNEVTTNTEVSLYPNPATDLVSINASAMVKDVVVCDQMGRVVMSAASVNRESYELNTARLSQGVYFVKLTFSNEQNTPVVKRIVIE